jgi:acetyl esterase
VAIARDPRVSPALSPELRQLPPIVLGVGRHDFLYEDNRIFADRLRAASVPLVYREYPTLPHGFFSWVSVSRAAEQAADDLCRELGTLLGQPSVPG